jgi:hypothetical protein
MKVRIPSSRTLSGDAPGPFAGLSRGGTWFGGSRIVSPKHKPLALEARRVETGPLFVEYRLHYRFEGNASYAATVRAIAGYDHLQFFEEMNGFDRGSDRNNDGARMEMTWPGFHPAPGPLRYRRIRD